MSDVNVHVLAGTVAYPPDYENGKYSMVYFKVKTTKIVTRNGEKSTSSCIHNCVLFNPKENIYEDLKQGCRVSITGEINARKNPKTDAWETQTKVITIDITQKAETAPTQPPLFNSPRPTPYDDGSPF